MTWALWIFTLAIVSAADGLPVNNVKSGTQTPATDSGASVELNLWAPSLLKDSGLAQNPFFNQKAPDAELKFRLFPFSSRQTGGFFISGGLGYNIFDLGMAPGPPQNAWKFVYGSNYQNLFFDVSVGYQFDILKNRRRPGSGGNLKEGFPGWGEQPTIKAPRGGCNRNEGKENPPCLRLVQKLANLQFNLNPLTSAV